MDGKIKKVQRWLERCLVACKSRSWENALADMECASAELETARRELWSIVDGSRSKVRTRRISRSIGASVAAAVFVLVAAFPVSMPEPVRRAVRSSLAWEDQKALLELVTRDEREMLLMLRKNLSSANVPERAPEVPAIRKNQPDRVSMRAVKVEKTGRSVKDGVFEGEVPLDQFIELMKIGQRALRTDDGPVLLE
ncbi:hypothetical protein Dpep_0258 [Dethiosulfovibrio peptidovorans DSM 11002]|uniref:Uncharacterized protein n=1 Tax=Dethiosulfovibrio peptidovorans DSM 11002 TaxID=469381 RepID=D2Z3I4_9BACT|nr:hypothetical protein [Dethiosulfovibrio peptidovorans]EFC90290.1 hypothetical protein Dpep_0258 [Dethiosulfovibrio peptidovorans DSM 11002]